MYNTVSGKVRDIYEINDHELLIAASDRISAFDYVLPVLIHNKGKILTKISSFWFEYTKDIMPNHVISTASDDYPEYFKRDEFKERSMLVKRLKMLPYEFVVRGYMFGGLWDSYKNTKEYCGYSFDEEYKLAQKLKNPIITPSAKNREGHDVAVSIQHLQEALGREAADELIKKSLALYEKCFDYAYKKGIIIADTKFEFGIDEEGSLILADEIFTPDSSRFWIAQDYKPGISPKSYDKQFLRDWLIDNGLRGRALDFTIPSDIIKKTEQIYEDCYRALAYNKA